MNTVNISGTVVSLRYHEFNDGSAVLNMLLAVERPSKNRNGIPVKRDSTYVPIVVWGRYANTQARRLTVGSRVTVQGTLNSRRRDNRLELEVTADRIEWNYIKETGAKVEAFAE